MSGTSRCCARRLLLRLWRDADLAPFAALNADPVVMEFLPGLLTRADSDALAARLQAAIDARGFAFWAIELRDSRQFAGFTGLSVPRIEAPFTPCIEVGWRLARGHWGQGDACYMARAAQRRTSSTRHSRPVTGCTRTLCAACARRAASSQPP